MKKIFNTTFWMEDNGHKLWTFHGAFVWLHLTPQFLFCAIIFTTSWDIECQRKNRSNFHGVPISMNCPTIVILKPWMSLVFECPVLFTDSWASLSIAGFARFVNPVIPTGSSLEDFGPQRGLFWKKHTNKVFFFSKKSVFC